MNHVLVDNHHKAILNSCHRELILSLQRKSIPIFIHRRLPKVLVDIIWSFDDRYKVDFKKCVGELSEYFNHNRVLSRLVMERNIYKTYLNITREPHTYFTNRCDNYSQYLFARIKKFGDCVQDDNLDHCGKYRPNLAYSRV